MMKMPSARFTNPNNLDGCQQCPVLQGSCEPKNASAAGCCGTASGVFENGFYEPGKYRLGIYAFDSRAMEGLGTKQPLQESERLWRSAQAVIPGGSQTFSKAPMCFVDGVTPKFLKSGRGARVWDVDGNQYIDYGMACGPLTLGYCVPEVDEAIKAQLSEGITFTLMHPLETSLAERLVERIPCAEMVRFGKNGGDATNIAVRLARFVTGREKVAFCGYHGFHDWYIGTTDRHYGVLEAVRRLSIPFRYNDIHSLQDVFARNKGEVACVIMEPALFEFPKDGFLEQVKALAHGEGALLIFDEMLTGFRFAEGGGQEFFGVMPDLATLGKGITNGMPLGVVAGPERYMRHFDKVFWSTTYGGEALTLAAGVANLDFYRRHQVVRRLWKSGLILLDNFVRLIAEKGVGKRVRIVGYPVRHQLVFTDGAGEPDYNLAGLYQQEMIKRGILCWAGPQLSYSHTDDELMYTVQAGSESLEVIAKALDSSDVAKFLEGKPPEPVFRALRERRQTAN